MGFLHSSLRGFSVLSHLAQSLLVSGGGCACRCPCSPHTPCPAASSQMVLRSWSCAWSSGQGCWQLGRCVGTVWAQNPGMALGKPRAGQCQPKPLPAHPPGRGRQRAKNPNCCFKTILRRALNADTLATGMYS